ncbi:MAG: HRDC domain-containing protein [Gemmatimonadetes bacterium]|nr:HRDC domain-containing protein [Gemmatimonadota bacterium]
MKSKSKPRQDPALVSSDEALKAFIEPLQEAKRIAFDTEAASFHRYVDRIYLIQISSDTETAIIDPLAISNLKAVGRLLANPAIEAVFHDADYDLRVLDRDYGFHARNLFDTRIAAQLLGEPGIGLGPLLQKYFRLSVDKKLQRADWSRRPLTPEMISYAAGDTRHLLSLRDELHGQLESRGRLEWAQEEFKRLEAIRWNPDAGNPDAFLRIKGAKALSPRSLSILKTVHEWREATAASLDRAPFRVLGNDALTALARTAPTTRRRLRSMNGVPSSAIRRYGDDLLKAVQRGLETPPEKYPKVERNRRPKISPAAQQRLERLKALRRVAAKDLGIEIGVLCPNGTLQAIAVAAPTTTRDLRKVLDLKRWQCAAVGSAELLQAVGDGA